jgi:hypothetical protein
MRALSFLPSPRTPQAIRGPSPELTARPMASGGRWFPGSAFGGPGMTTTPLILQPPAWRLP